MPTLTTASAGRPPIWGSTVHTWFRYQAGSWSKSRRVVAKVEWHPGALYPRVGFIVANMTRPAERGVACCNQRGTAEQHIEAGKNAVTWTRLSCHRFAANAVRLQLHALAYSPPKFLRTVALPDEIKPDEIKQGSLTTLRERLVKIGARIVRHGRSFVVQMAEVTVPRALFAESLERIARLRAPPASA